MMEHYIQWIESRTHMYGVHIDRYNRYKFNHWEPNLRHENLYALQDKRETRFKLTLIY